MNDDFDSFPDEIIYEKTIEVKDKMTILVFNFKAKEPHPFAEKGWLKGYVGYKRTEINSFINPDFVLSEFRNEILLDSDLEKIL